MVHSPEGPTARELLRLSPMQWSCGGLELVQEAGGGV